MPITQSGTFFNNGTEARPRGPPPRGPVPLRGLNPMPVGMHQNSHFGSFSSGTAVSRVGTYTGDQQMPAFRPMMQMGHPMDPSAQLFPAMLKKVANLKDNEELWVSATSPDGKEYYYKTITRETVWEKPENAVIVDQAKLTELIEMANEEIRKEMSGKSANANNPWNEYTAPDGRKYYYNSVTQETTWEKPKPREESKKAAKEQPPAPTAAPAAANAKVDLPDMKQHKPHDARRPVSSNAVVGTPWCVVWTGDNKVFFFNPTTRTSVWERPPELYNRPDVDMLISKPPAKKIPKASLSSMNLNAPNAPAEPMTQVMSVDNSSDVEMEEASSDEEERPPPPKRTRTDSARHVSPSPSKGSSRGQSPAEKPVDPAVQAELDAQRERQETPLEERLLKFKEMLEEKDISVGSTFEKELSKIVFDKRYLLLGSTERRAAFESFVKEKAEIERSERKKKLKENKQNFRELLEEAKLRSNSSFSSFARTYGRDERFKCIDRMRDREDLFNDYTRELEKNEREERKQKKQKAREEFLQLLKEAHEKAGFDRQVKWSTVKKALEDDERYGSKYLSSDTREDIFKKFINDLPPAIGSDEEEDTGQKQTENASATELAIESRKKAVEAELDETMKDRLRESEKQKVQEQEVIFKALLVDQIKSPGGSWRDIRKTLRKDSRYNDCDALDKSAKEKLYNEHMRSLEAKRQEAFFQLLNETEGVHFKLSWRDARKIMEKDKRYSKYDLRDRDVEDDFRDWRDQTKEEVRRNFTDLLRETKIITYKSVELIHDSEQHLKDILAVLENDKRYLVMDCIPNEREKLLEKYLKDVAENGPPPPPTQQEGERKRK